MVLGDCDGSADVAVVGLMVLGDCDGSADVGTCVGAVVVLVVLGDCDGAGLSLEDGVEV